MNKEGILTEVSEDGLYLLIKVPLKPARELVLEAFGVDLHEVAKVKLTRREVECLSGVRRGLQNKEIADELCISERTVKFHVSSLLAKFHVSGRIKLVDDSVLSALWPTLEHPPVIDNAIPRL